MIDKYIKEAEGFTLVELSIVIIIIGFLIAGISAGTNLISSAKMSLVVSEMQQYQTAYNSFVERYSGVPGDMLNTEAWWPYGANGCALNHAGDCDGNNDGLITLWAGQADETYACWRELDLAGLIDTNIAPIPHGWQENIVLDKTYPSSKAVSGAGYLMIGPGVSIFGHFHSPWNDNATNAVFLGKNGTIIVNFLLDPALNAEDAFNIDKKIDDGAIDSSGNFNGANTGNFRTFTAEIGACLASASAYDVTQTAPGCVSGLALN